MNHIFDYEVSGILTGKLHANLFLPYSSIIFSMMASTQTFLLLLLANLFIRVVLVMAAFLIFSPSFKLREAN